MRTRAPIALSARRRPRGTPRAHHDGDAARRLGSEIAQRRQQAGPSVFSARMPPPRLKISVWRPRRATAADGDAAMPAASPLCGM